MNEWIEKIDDDTLMVSTADGRKRVSRYDKVEVLRGSGWVTYGEVGGDYCMVSMIYEDCQDAFEEAVKKS